METQASRTERLTITATPAERRAVHAVALVRGIDVSNLLRQHVLAEILGEYERMAAALSGGDTQQEAAA